MGNGIRKKALCINQEVILVSIALYIEQGDCVSEKQLRGVSDNQCYAATSVTCVLAHQRGANGDDGGNHSNRRPPEIIMAVNASCA